MLKVFALAQTGIIVNLASQRMVTALLDMRLWVPIRAAPGSIPSHKKCPLLSKVASFRIDNTPRIQDISRVISNADGGVQGYGAVALVIMR